MSVYGDILKELMIAGYEGSHLHAAFERLSAIIESGMQTGSASAKDARPANDSRPIARAAAPVVAPAVAVTAPPENAKAVARKAIAQSMLSPSTIALASHLIERFNLETGRCDPGTGSLADDLGISVRQARRSIASLVSSGLFGKARHGGRALANAYQPNWPLIVERAAEGDISAKRPMLSANAANVVTQNQRTKPDSDSMVGKAQRKRAARERDRRQVEMMMPIGGGREQSEEAVRAKLFGQLDAHLRETFLPSDKAGFARCLTGSMEIGTSWQAAIKSEMRKAGEGLPVLLQAIDALCRVRIGLGGSGR